MGPILFSAAFHGHNVTLTVLCGACDITLERWVSWFDGSLCCNFPHFFGSKECFPLLWPNLICSFYLPVGIKIFDLLTFIYPKCLESSNLVETNDNLCCDLIWKRSLKSVWKRWDFIFDFSARIVQLLATRSWGGGEYVSLMEWWRHWKNKDRRGDHKEDLKLIRTRENISEGRHAQ